ncbi:hypothetical protein HID58_095366, partial [Brassica napus]
QQKERRDGWESVGTGRPLEDCEIPKLKELVGSTGQQNWKPHRRKSSKEEIRATLCTNSLLAQVMIRKFENQMMIDD